MMATPLPAALALLVCFQGVDPQAPAAGADPEMRPPQVEGEVIGLSLEQALAIALSRDLGLKLQGLAAEIAHHRSEGSWGVFDPVFATSAGYTDSETEFFNAAVGPTVIEEDTWSVDSSLVYPLSTGGDLSLNYLLAETDTDSQLVQGTASATTDIIGLNFNQPLLRGAGSTYTHSEQREADLGYRKELADYRLVDIDLQRSVADAYWDLVAARANLGVARESLALGEAQLDQNQRRLDAGVGTEVEVLQSEADLATRREDLIEREMTVKDAADLLKLRLFPGTNTIYWSAEIEPTTELPEIRIDDVPTWQSAAQVALEQRPDLARERLEIEAAEERLLRATSEQRPQLDFSVGTSARGFDASRQNAFEDALGWDFPTSTAALTFSYPIGNRAAESAERAARAALRSARLVHDDLQSQIVAEVRLSQRRVLFAAETVSAAETSVSLARRQLEAEEARFREGLATNFQVLEFQEDLTLAQFTLVQARATFVKARAALARAQGKPAEDGSVP